MFSSDIFEDNYVPYKSLPTFLSCAKYKTQGFAYILWLDRYKFNIVDILRCADVVQATDTPPETKISILKKYAKFNVMYEITLGNTSNLCNENYYKFICKVLKYADFNKLIIRGDAKIYYKNGIMYNEIPTQTC